ncbi:unnamed protein product [Lampetra fluviatilis]
MVPRDSITPSMRPISSSSLRRQAGPSLDGAWMGDHCRTAKPQLDHHRLEMPPTWGGKSSRHRDQQEALIQQQIDKEGCT